MATAQARVSGDGSGEGGAPPPTKGDGWGEPAGTFQLDEVWALKKNAGAVDSAQENPQEFSDLPIIVAQEFAFPTLSPAWAVTNRKTIEGALEKTFGIVNEKDGEKTGEVTVTAVAKNYRRRVRSLREESRAARRPQFNHDDVDSTSPKMTNTATAAVSHTTSIGGWGVNPSEATFESARETTSAKKRKTQTDSGPVSKGCRVDFVVALKFASEFMALENNLFGLTNSTSPVLANFLENLDAELESKGVAPIGLGPYGVQFRQPRLKHMSPMVREELVVLGVESEQIDKEASARYRDLPIVTVSSGQVYYGEDSCKNSLCLHKGLCGGFHTTLLRVCPP